MSADPVVLALLLAANWLTERADYADSALRALSGRPLRTSSEGKALRSAAAVVISAVEDVEQAANQQITCSDCGGSKLTALHVVDGCPAANQQVCADCGEAGELTGHMGCQYPQDHP